MLKSGALSFTRPSEKSTDGPLCVDTEFHPLRFSGPALSPVFLAVCFPGLNPVAHRLVDATTATVKMKADAFSQHPLPAVSFRPVRCENFRREDGTPKIIPIDFFKGASARPLTGYHTTRAPALPPKRLAELNWEEAMPANSSPKKKEVLRVAGTQAILINSENPDPRRTDDAVVNTESGRGKVSAASRCHHANQLAYATR